MLGFETFSTKPHGLLCAVHLGRVCTSGLEVQAVQAQGAGELDHFLGLMPVPLCFSVSKAEVVSHISRELSQSLLVSKQQSSFSGRRFEFSVLRQKIQGGFVDVCFPRQRWDGL